MAITEITLHRIAELQAVVDDYVDASTRALTARWAEAWQEVAQEWQDTITVILAKRAAGEPLTPAQVTQLARTQRALAMTARKLQELAAEIGPLLEDSVREVVERTADLTTSVAASQLPDVDQRLLPSFTRVDQTALDQIITRTLEQIHASSLPLADDAVDAMTSALIRAVPSGWHPDKAAREMLKRTRSGFNGGLTRAMRIARTEMLTASRRANQAQNLANPTVTGWIWQASMSPRTCPACLAMSGTVHPPEEYGPAGHPNCRCTALPRTKTWKEMGFDIEEPPSLLPDPEQWLRDNPHDAVRALGPDRYRMWMDGDIALKDMATLVKNPDWMDHYVATPISALKAQVRASR